MEHICTCNNCGKLFIDTNPQVDAKKFDVDYLDLEEIISTIKQRPKMILSIKYYGEF